MLLVLFVALPVVAAPPVVLPETLALPEDALWLVVLTTEIVLLFCTLVFMFEVALTVTGELGPWVDTF